MNNKTTSDNDIYHTFSNKSNIKSLRYLFKYLSPYKGKLYCMMVALIITSSSILLLSKSVEYVIDNGLSHKNAEMLDKSLLYFISIILVLSIATCVRFFLITLVGELVIRDIRRDVYNQILRLSPSFYETNKSGEILARLTTDTTLLQSIIGSNLSFAMRNALMFVGSIAMLIISNTKLTALMSFVIPLVVVPILFFGRKMRKYSKISQDKVADISAVSEETIGFIKTIQAYAREEFEKLNFENKLTQSILTAIQRIKVRSILTAVIIALAFGAITIVLWVGGYDVLSGRISPGELSSFILLSIICATSLAALSEAAGELQKAAGASQRLIEFLRIKPDIADTKNTIILSDNTAGIIEFQNVTFSYPSKEQKPSLKHVSFKVEKGKTIALVGKSGAGKTTILQLILRFYNTKEGSILFDGINISGIQLQSLREQFAYVSQDPVVFSASAYQNILYGKPQSSLDQVKEAAKAAAALDFIEKLPNGFDTFLGEKGVRISGGERQRIAIARAILKNPKILLLDEATSALDSHNEKLVQKALDHLMENRTTIVIAHRLSTIMNADKIIVLHEGQIIEQGTHKELINNGGEYEKLANATLT